MSKIKVMGILNVTPDSFSDGGKYLNSDKAVRHAISMLEEGVDIIDIGAESSRPGAELLSFEQEWERLKPILQQLQHEKIVISIDTQKPQIMQHAVKYGAKIWNDISAATYCQNSLAIAAKLGCELVLMHKKGIPQTMQNDPQYEDVIKEIKLYLQQRVQQAVQSGIDLNKIYIDPGIGFGKNLQHNLKIINSLSEFRKIAKVLLGVSRKSCLQQFAQQGGVKDIAAEKRIGGSIAAAIYVAQAGVNIIRCHDVYETKHALAVWDALLCEGNN